MKRSRKKKRTGKSPIQRRIRLVAVSAVLVLILLFLLLFKVEKIIVTGNSRYTDKQIKDMCINEEGFNNSVFFALFNRHIEIQDVPLLDYVDTVYIDRNTIQLKAHEKLTIGMFRVGDKVCCIDQDGMVIEILDYEGSESLGLPIVTGLSSKGTVGEIIELEDYSVLNTLQALKSSFDKYNVVPDTIDISEEEKNKKTVKTFSLKFGNVTVLLGADEYLEEKLRRTVAILPQLEGMSGTLHLEYYNEETENIVFDIDGAEEKTQEIQIPESQAAGEHPEGEAPEIQSPEEQIPNEQPIEEELPAEQAPEEQIPEQAPEEQMPQEQMIEE